MIIRRHTRRVRPRRMDEAVAALKVEMGRVRAGRAIPGKMVRADRSGPGQRNLGGALDFRKRLLPLRVSRAARHNAQAIIQLNAQGIHHALYGSFVPPRRREVKLFTGD